MPYKPRTRIVRKGNYKYLKQNGRTIAKKGLNTKEKREVTTLAKKAIQNVAEEKYMNTKQYIGLTPRASNVPSRVSVLAFSTSLSETADGNQLNYGVDASLNDAPILPLKMLRPFNFDTGTDRTENYKLVGRECMPRSASVKWRFSRDIGQALTGITSDWNTTAVLPSHLSPNLPIICRSIMVEPKQSQTNILCDPAQDVFLDRFNTATGIDSEHFNDLEMLTMRLNRRRYNVVSDRFFRIQNGLTVGMQRTLAQPAAGSLVAAQQPVITNTNSNCEKVITTHHQLTRKKNGRVFYDTPNMGEDAPEAPSSGHKRTFILHHFIYAGAESYIDNPDIVTQGYPNDLKLSVVPMTKFTDI